jgi:hypothetical protein
MFNHKKTCAAFAVFLVCQSKVAVAVSVNVVSKAHEGNLQHMVYGQGRQLCEQYVESRRQAEAGQYLQLNYFRQWMAGYMSSYNYHYLQGAAAVADSGDENTIESELEIYCSKHPQEKFASAAAVILKKLQERK